MKLHIRRKLLSVSVTTQYEMNNEKKKIRRFFKAHIAHDYIISSAEFNKPVSHIDQIIHDKQNRLDCSFDKTMTVKVKSANVVLT